MAHLNARPLIVFLIMMVPLVLIAALFIGPVISSVETVGNALMGNADNVEQLIVRDIRMPRAVFALLCGALLASCGAVCQGLFRNPLADPSLIGVTGGASMGASLVIALGFIAGPIMTSLFAVSMGAFLGGSLATFFVYRLSINERGASVSVMLLAGIAVTAFASAVTNLCEFFSDNEHLRRISIWRMGSLEGASWMELLALFVLLIVVLVILIRASQSLNALLLGESEARHLGIDVDSLKRRIILVVAMAVGICVAMAGTISFVGLIVPHLIRILIGPDHRYLTFGSALGGGLLLLIADTLARTSFAPEEVPVGVITALAGAPFFIFMLRQRRNSIGG